MVRATARIQWELTYSGLVWAWQEGGMVGGMVGGRHGMGAWSEGGMVGGMVGRELHTLVVAGGCVASGCGHW